MCRYLVPVVRTCLIAPIKLGKEAGGESVENDGGRRHVTWQDTCPPRQETRHTCAGQWAEVGAQNIHGHTSIDTHCLLGK